MGSARALGLQHRHLPAALRCRSVLVDDRLAPETLFPGAIEDEVKSNAVALRKAGDWLAIEG